MTTRSDSDSQSVAFLLSQIGARSAELFAAELRPLGVAPRAFGVLSNLDAADGQTQQQLADALGIHRNNMVGLVDDLEAAGWVRRHRSDVDRRAFNIQLTDTGAELIAQIQNSIAAVEQTLTAELTDGEHAEMKMLLKRMAAGLGLRPGVHPHLRGHYR